MPIFGWQEGHPAHGSLWAGCPSCHPTIGIKGLKGSQSFRGSVLEQMEEKDPRGDSCWLGSRKGIRPVKK